ncbi:MAG TPA: transglycosylase SLT domain-containing protein [Guyparkeria sp.]|nr:transglycosylase SLT domain-containing protein [Guyparkeria sp.]
MREFLSSPSRRVTRLAAVLLAIMLPFATPVAWGSLIAEEPPEGLAAGLLAIEHGDRSGFERALESIEHAQHGEAMRLYLQTRWLLDRIDGESAAVAARLREYPQAPLTSLLKRRYLDHLAKQKAWGQYRLVFERPPAISPGTRQQCDYWHATMVLDETLKAEQADEAMAVWLRGRSQPEACDPVFAWLETNAYLDETAYRARTRAAVSAGQDGLARYLVRSGPTGLGGYRDRWLALRDQPATTVTGLIEAEGDSDEISQGLLWLARKEPEQARALLRRATALELVDEQQAGQVARLAALKTAYLYQPQAYQWLRELPDSAKDHEVWTWTARSALRRLDWAQVKQAIDAMPESIAAEREWQFWRAEAEHRLGQVTAAHSAWRKLADTPDYHGFLAADRLGIQYALPVEARVPTVPSPEDVAALEADSWLALAFALHRLDHPEDARRLFTHALDALPADRLPALAWLADQAGWADRASVVLARLEAFHEPEWLAARYALPYRTLVEEQADRQSIPPEWIYSVIRRESLFMRDIGSGAGAQGLMQLMPATARWINSQAGLEFAPLHLSDPGVNIALGAAYLAQMVERFDDKHPLAIAAYNAGPGRIRGWLPEAPMSGDVWVDTILFDETRAYTRAVLAGMVIYHWRLTGKPQRLGKLLPVIPAAG